MNNQVQGQGDYAVEVLVLPDEGGVIHMDKCCHKELAVKAVQQTPVAWNGICKVLNKQNKGQNPSVN